MSDKKTIKPPASTTAGNKPASNKPVIKKAAASKKAKSTKKATTNNVEPVATAEPSIQSIIEEMNSQRNSRDKQISSLIEEIRDGFVTLSNNTSQQGEEHQKEMTDLYQSLKGAFGHIKDNNTENEKNNLSIFKSLSDSMMNDHQQTLLEIREQEQLQDKKIKHMTKALEQRTVRNRWIAIPGVIIAIIGVFYMFYVVSIMESAMSNMSANMDLMQQDVSKISGSMGDLSQDTSSINSNMAQLNGNMGMVSQDLSVMNRNVSPAMSGMNKMMPWK